VNFLQLSRKIIAPFIIVAFSTTNLFAPIPASYAAPEILTPPSLFWIPDTLGRVTDFIEAPQSSGTFIHIQTAHGQYEAQKNIQAILNFLSKNNGTKLLLLEGASHKLQPELFRFFPQDKELNSKILDALIQNAQFTGAESFLVEASNDLQGWGVENADAYKGNLEAFKRVILHKDASEAFLNSFYMELEKAAASHLNKELKAFLRTQKSHEREMISLAEWLRYLKKQSISRLDLDFEQISNQKKWPVLVRYFRLEEIGKGIDEAKVEKEKKNFLNELKGLKISLKLIRAFEDSWGEKRGQSLRKGTVPFSTRFLFEQLLDALPESFSFKAYSNLRIFIQQQILTEELLGEKLYEETDRLTNQLLETLAKTKEEKEILVRFKNYQFLKKLLNLELSRTEYETRSPAPFPLPSGERVKVRGEVDILFQEALQFYEGAIEREKWMIQNAVQRMKDLKQNQPVLITGGFHAQGLKQMILDSGFSYVQITPRIHEISKDAQKLYLQAMIGQSLVRHSKVEPPLRSDIHQFRGFDTPFVQETGQTIFQLMNRVIVSERPQKKDEFLPVVQRSELAQFFSVTQRRSEIRSDDSEINRLALTHASIPVVEVKSTLIERIEGEEGSYRLIRDESTLRLMLEEILKLEGRNVAEPVDYASKFTSVKVNGKPVPLDADYILKKDIRVTVSLVQPRAEVRNQVEGPKGAEPAIEQLLESVKTGRSEVRHYKEDLLAASLDKVFHEIFRHYRRHRKSRHMSVTTFPKTYALEIEDSGDVRLIDTENASALLVSLPFNKPHIYFTQVMQAKAIHIKSIAIQFEEDIPLDTQSNLEERLKNFLVTYFAAWAYPTDFSKISPLLVAHSHTEENDGKNYISPRQKPTRHKVTLSRAEVRNEKITVQKGQRSELRAKAATSRPIFGFTRLERLSQLEEESNRLMADIFKVKAEANFKKARILNPSKRFNFENDLNRFRGSFGQLLFQVSSISGAFNEIDENFRISPSPYPEETRPFLDRMRRQIQELDESFQALGQDLEELQLLYNQSIHSDFENSQTFLDLVRQAESLRSDIKILLAVKEKVPYGVISVQWAGQMVRFIWGFIRSWWKGEVSSWAASYRKISKQERHKRVEVTLRHIQETLLDYQKEGIFQIDDYDQLNFVVDSVKRDFIGIMLAIPFPLRENFSGESLRPIYDLDFSFLLVQSPKRPAAVPRSELRNEDEPEKKPDDETTSIIQVPYEDEFNDFIRTAYRLSTDKGFDFQALREFLHRFIHWKSLIIKFDTNQTRYESIFTPLRENALAAAWRRIVLHQLIPLLQQGKIKFSIAFYNGLNPGDLILPGYVFDFSNTERLAKGKDLVIYIFNNLDDVSHGVNLTMGLVSSFIQVPFDRFQKHYVVLVPASRSEIRQPRGAIEHILDKLVIYKKIFNRTSRARIREKMVKKVARLWALRHRQASFSSTHEAEDGAFLSALSDAFAVAVLKELNRAKYANWNRPISLAEDFKVHLVDLPEKYHPDRTKTPLDLLLAQQLSVEMIEEGLKGSPVTVQISELWVYGVENYHSSIYKILPTVLKWKNYESGTDYEIDVQTVPGAIPSQTSWSPASRSAGSRVTITFKGLHRAGQGGALKQPEFQRSELRLTAENQTSGGASRKGIQGVVLKITDGIIPLAVTLYGTEKEIDSLIEEFLKSVPAARLQSSIQNLRAEKFKTAGQILALQGDVIMLGPELIKQGGLAFAGTVFGEKPVIAIAPTKDIVEFVEDYNRRAVRLKKIRHARNVREAVQLLREAGKQPLRTQAYISSAESLDLAQALEKQLGDPNITRITPKMFDQTIARAELRDFVTDLRVRYQRLAQSA